MIDAKAITMGAVLLAGMAGLAMYYGQSDTTNADGTPSNKLNWNGKHFTSTVTADDGSIFRTRFLEDSLSRSASGTC